MRGRSAGSGRYEVAVQARASLVCARCQAAKPAADFSKTQFYKLPDSTCRECIDKRASRARAGGEPKLDMRLDDAIPPPEREQQLRELQCQQMLRAVMPPPELSRHDESTRARLEASLRSRWRHVRVYVYGSAGSGLRVGSASDLDLAVEIGGSHAEAVFTARAKLRQAEGVVCGIEAAHPDAARLLAEEAEAAREERIAAAEMRQLLLNANKAARREGKGGEPGGAAEGEAGATPDGVEPPEPPKRISGRCFKCGAPGHRSIDCPKGQTNGGGGKGVSEERLAAARARWNEAQADAKVAHEAATASEAGRLLGAARRVAEGARDEVNDTKRIVYAIAAQLRGAGYADIVPVARARTAVVKCVDPRGGVGGAGVELDVVVHNPLGTHNTALLRGYTDLSTRFREVCLLVKAWAKARGVAAAFSGTLSSYAHVLSVLHFFQAGCTRAEGAPPLPPLPPLLPDLQHPALVSREPPSVCDGLDVRFCHDSRAALDALAFAARAWRQDGPDRQAPPEPPPLSELLYRYFAFMAARGGGNDSCLAVRGRGESGFTLSKAKAWPRAAALPGREGRPSLEDRLSIEDPFETHDSGDPSRTHDVAATLSANGMARLRDEWRRAAALLAPSPDGSAPAGDVRDLWSPVVEAGGARKRGPARAEGKAGDGGNGGNGNGGAAQTRGAEGAAEASEGVGAISIA